jgi:uncharacterized membrane protein
VWRTFGLAVGVFAFSVTAALVIGDDPEVSVIVPAAEVVAVLAALAMIRALQVKAFASIQLAPTLSAIAAQGRALVTGPERTFHQDPLFAFRLLADTVPPDRHWFAGDAWLRPGGAIGAEVIPAG